MKKLGFLLVIAVAMAVGSDHCFSQLTVMAYQCVGVPGGTTCQGGGSTGLRGNMSTSFQYATVAGHNAPGDGGGGDYVLLGTASAVCQTYLSAVTGKGIVGQSKILSVTGVTFSHLLVGELVTGSGSDGTGSVQVQPGTEIASKGNGNIGLTLPLVGNSTNSTTGVLMNNITFTGDNDGTLINDSVTSGGVAAPQCWQKTDYRGDPHEFGAYGDGATDDTTALQNWLGAYGNVNATLAPNTAPQNFGPWDAVIPANYITNSQLTCGPGMNLRGPANDTLGGGGNPPLVQITAGTSFNSGMGGSAAAPLAVITAWAACRISGIAIEAAVNSAANLNNNYVDAVIVGPTIILPGTPPTPYTANNVVIDGHTLLQDGYENLYCNKIYGGIGLQVKDAQLGASWSNNADIQCGNTRLTDDIVNQAGGDYAGTPAATPNQAGVYFQGDNLSLIGGVVEASKGPGVELDGGYNSTVTGVFIDSNGQNPTSTMDWPGILINSYPSTHVPGPAQSISICGNNFHQSSDVTTAGSSSAHIRFYNMGKPVMNTVLCGNSYMASGTPAYPNYDYDDEYSTSNTTPPQVSIFENAAPQAVGAYSLNALTDLLPQQQAPLGVPNNYITGLTMLNVSGSASQVKIMGGSAADSTNEFMLQTAPCTVDLSASVGVGGPDASYSFNVVTLFYYIIGGPTVPTSCIVSENPNGPAKPTNYTYFRLVGILYNTSTTAWVVVPFVQDDDTVFLQTPVNGSASISSVGHTLTIAVVPNASGIEAFGRCTTSSGIAAMLTTTQVGAQAPSANFTSAPGWMINASTTPATSYPFYLYIKAPGGSPPLSPGGTIFVTPSTGGGTIYCEYDGWIWHRGR